jgi:hypothetical protein
MLDPILKKSKTEREDPNCILEKAEKALPILANLRIDMDEPMVRYANTETAS